MPPVRPLEGNFTVLGNRIPRVVVLVLGLTLLVSVLAAVGSRNGVPFVLQQAALLPALVWHGQLWRLVTWVFVEPDGIGLFFGGLLLVSLGRDLYYAWGAQRFLGYYLGIAAASGLATCLVGLLWPSLWTAGYFSMWPVVDAMIIAWAGMHPTRDVMLFFVLPARGRSLIIATFGLTLLLALMNGVAGFVPHFLAEGLMLAYMNPPSGLQRLWQRTRLRQSQKRSPKLRVVEREEPPRWLH
jgi:membrane associated rhomboid family serine protease